MARLILQRLNQLQLHGVAARCRADPAEAREPLMAETMLVVLISEEESKR